MRTPKGISYLETMPVSPDREAEYHKWDNETDSRAVFIDASMAQLAERIVAEAPGVGLRIVVGGDLPG